MKKWSVCVLALGCAAGVVVVFFGPAVRPRQGPSLQSQPTVLHNQGEMNHPAVMGQPKPSVVAPPDVEKSRTSPSEELKNWLQDHTQRLKITDLANWFELDSAGKQRVVDDLIARLRGEPQDKWSWDRALRALEVIERLEISDARLVPIIRAWWENPEENGPHLRLAIRVLGLQQYYEAGTLLLSIRKQGNHDMWDDLALSGLRQWSGRNRFTTGDPIAEAMIEELAAYRQGRGRDPKPASVLLRSGDPDLIRRVEEIFHDQNELPYRRADVGAWLVIDHPTWFRAQVNNFGALDRGTQQALVQGLSSMSGTDTSLLEAAVQREEVTVQNLLRQALQTGDSNLIGPALAAINRYGFLFTEEVRSILRHLYNSTTDASLKKHIGEVLGD